MKFTSIDRAACRRIKELAEAALAPLEAETGLKFTAKPGSFTASNFTFKVEAALVDEDGQVKSAEAEAFKMYAPIHGMSPDDLHAETCVGGKMFRIAGYKPRARKNPILLEPVDGSGLRVCSIGAAKAGMLMAKMGGDK